MQASTALLAADLIGIAAFVVSGAAAAAAVAKQFDAFGVVIVGCPRPRLIRTRRAVLLLDWCR